MNHFRAGGLAEAGPASIGLALGVGDQLFERPFVDTGGWRQTLFDHRRGDFEQRSLDEVADKTGVRPVIDDRRRARLASAIQPGLQQPNPHLAGVQAALVRRLVLDVAVRIPLFDRRFDEANTILSAPAEHVERFDVPRQVDDDVARTHELAQHRLVVSPRQTSLFEQHAGVQRIRDLLPDILEINDGDSVGRQVDVAANERKGALADRSAPEHQDASVKWNALRSLSHVRFLLIATLKWRNETERPTSRFGRTSL